MKKRFLVGLLVVVLAISASVAIHAGVNSLNYEPIYVAAEINPGCCPVDDTLISPNNDWCNGGWGPTCPMGVFNCRCGCNGWRWPECSC